MQIIEQVIPNEKTAEENVHKIGHDQAGVGLDHTLRVRTACRPRQEVRP